MAQEMVNFGSALVFPLDIVAIEKGAWSDQEQDWTAILVASGGARIRTEVYMKTVKMALEHARFTSVAQ